MKNLTILLLLIIGFSACVNEDFDEPPIGTFPDLTANFTIAELKALHTIGSNATEITDDLIIEGTVVSSDQAGNFFREIIVEDETGAIIVRVNTVDNFAQYPRGSRVFVRLQGLFIGDFNEQYQLNGAPDARIEEVLVPETVIATGETVELMPTVLTIAELANPATFNRYKGSLIQINNVQFIGPDTSVTFADAVNLFSVNRTLIDCNGDQIIVRSSGFSDFATELTPTGSGTITAVLTAFGQTRQLVISDPSDLMLTGERCGISVGGDLISIEDVRDLYTGSATNLPANRKISGIVISDRSTSNLNARNLFIQDGEFGIVLRFAANHSFNLGDRIEVGISGLELSEFNGLLQINNVPLANAEVQNTGNTVTPRVATIAQIIANNEEWESTLVTVEDATFTGGPTFSGGVTLMDGTGSLDIFTLFGATFADINLPTEAGDVTAIISEFNTDQLILRNLDDVEADTGGGGGGGGGGDVTQISVGAVRDLFNGVATTAPANRFIRGVVISDAASGNITGRNLVLQDGERGIVVRFSDVHEFALNEDIRIDIGGLEISEFSGLLQINNVPNANATSFGVAAPVTPREITLNELIDNGEEWESTLVKVNGATLSGSSTYNGSINVTDGTATFAMFTRS
ncbi:MAG: DUF5689 domain-containing protein, partial [Saprospiraceae bacterium]